MPTRPYVMAAHHGGVLMFNILEATREGYPLTTHEFLAQELERVNFLIFQAELRGDQTTPLMAMEAEIQKCLRLFSPKTR